MTNISSKNRWQETTVSCRVNPTCCDGPALEPWWSRFIQRFSAFEDKNR